MRHRPELDGVRGIAIALVVLSHAGVPGFRWGGQVGVTLFFVLSGYLITGVLMDQGRREFYWRRARRLLPALAVLLAVALVVGWATLRDELAIALYVGNWVRATGGDLGYLGHTWSLAIEEQFYLVWPLLFMAGLRSPRILLALAAGSIVLRTIASGDVEQFSTLTRMDGLLVGCAIALAGRALSGRWAVVGIVGLLALSAATPLSLDGAVTGATIAAALLVMGARPGWLSVRPLVWLGGISYALYLWHQPLLLTFPNAAAVPMAFLFAWASTRYLEAPFRRMRRPRLLAHVVGEPHERVGSGGGGEDAVGGDKAREAQGHVPA